MQRNIYLYHIASLLIISHAELPGHTKQPNVNVREMLKKLGVIPHVLPDCPNVICKVHYEFASRHQKLYKHDVVPGERLLDNETMWPPSVTWPDVDNDALHTIFLSGSTKWRKDLYPTMKPLAKDEDYRQMQEWENWVVINMRGDNESDAKHLVTYLIPGCPLFRDVEEYFTFLIYKQSREIPYTSIKKAEFPHEGREKYHLGSTTLMDFVKMHNLTGPIAVNFFTTRYQLTLEDVISSRQWANATAKATTPITSSTYYPTQKLATIKHNILNMIKNYSAKYNT